MSCSVAAFKSIGTALADNKVYGVLFDSGSSKTLIHKQTVHWNFTPIPSSHDLQIFLLAGATTSMTLVALNKVRYPESNSNKIVDQHPTLVIDSMSLCYDIIFGADFLDKCRITLDYDHNLVWWMEYTIPLHNALEFLSYSYYTSLQTQIELESELFPWQCICRHLCYMHS